MTVKNPQKTELSLNQKGRALVVALARYVAQHGNVRGEAGTIAHLLLEITGESAPFSDGVPPDAVNANVTREMRAALQALKRKP